MIIVVNVDTTLDEGFTNYVVDASSNDVIMTLPEITGEGTEFTITRNDMSNNTVTIVPFGSQTIDNQVSYNLSINNALTVIA